MKQIKILKADKLEAGKVEIEKYQPHSFTQNQEYLSSMQIIESFRKRSNKQSIKKLAKRNSISYDDKQIAFATEIINIMLDEISDGK